MGIRKNLGDYRTWHQNLPGSFYSVLAGKMADATMSQKVKNGEYAGQPRFQQIDRATGTYRLNNNIVEFDDFDAADVDTFEAFKYLTYCAFARKAGEEAGEFVDVNMPASAEDDFDLAEFE